jgi:hypothetical protein
MTKKQISDPMVKELDEKINALQEERKELFKKQAPINAKLVKTANEIDKLTKERDDLLIKGLNTKHPDWDYLLECNWHGSHAKSIARDKFLTPYSLKSNGYYEKTQQVQIEVMLNYKQRIDKPLRKLRELLPHIKPLDNVRRFGIFEHTLSEFGVFELIVAKDSEKCRLVKTTYGRQADITKFNDLKEALIYIAEHHWYEGGPREVDC